MCNWIYSQRITRPKPIMGGGVCGCGVMVGKSNLDRIKLFYLIPSFIAIAKVNVFE